MPNQLINRGRATGRTQRLIDDALDRARKGRIVYIIVNNKDQEGHVKRRLQHTAIRYGLVWAADQNVRVTPVTDPSVSEGQPGDYTVRFGPPDHDVLVDHWVYESRYGAAIDGWLRSQYDQP